jgi:hypothetical protein
MKRTASVVGGMVFGFVLGIMAAKITPAHAQYYGQGGKVYITNDDSPGFGNLPSSIPGTQVVGFSCVAQGDDNKCFIASVK